MSTATDERPAPTRRRTLNVQSHGRCAELVVDTGHVLSTGRTWLAFARIPCANVYTAHMLADTLRRRIHDAVTEARREAYRAGYDDAIRGRAPQRHFHGDL